MEPYVGLIVPVAFAFAPKNWALCNGQLLGIQQNQALFVLLGTSFGGDGRTTFGLPDLRGRTPAGAAAQVGNPIGTETVILDAGQLPGHSHSVNATTAAGAGRPGLPTGKIFGEANPASVTIFGQPSSLVPLSMANVSPTGSNLPHGNMQPFLVLNYIIALQGIFPSRS